jgi:hypothetical protein
VKPFLILAWCAVLIASGCGAASDVSTLDGPTTLPLVDAFDTVVATDPTDATTSEPRSPRSSEAADPTTTQPSDDASTTTDGPVSTTEAPSSTTSTVAPITALPTPDYTEYCAASASITALGTFSGFGNPAATEEYFAAQVAAWNEAAALAPAVIASDVANVASFTSQLLDLLADNDYDITAVIAEAAALEASSGSDNAKIVVDQFSFISCEAEPPLAEQQTAVFYVSLLDTAERRAVLAELLAGEEIFDLDGATCFVESVTPTSMFSFTGAPSTPDQDAALVAALDSCGL